MKTILVDAVDVFVDEDGKIFDDVRILLDTYPNKKILVTNADYESTNKFGLNEMPYEVFTLKHDPKKTDPAYFKTFLNTFDLGADDVVYFEHSKEAISAAESVGIRSHYFNEKERDITSLKNFLDVSCLQ